MSRITIARAVVLFKNGSWLEFESSGNRGFPPQELIKLNNYAKKRAGVLFVLAAESGEAQSEGQQYNVVSSVGANEAVL